MLKQKDALLRLALRANAGFSGLCGLSFVVAANQIARFIGLNTPIAIFCLGVMLLLFGCWLLWLSSRKTLDSLQARIVVALDLAWVMGSVVLLTTGVPTLTDGGRLAMLVIGLIVADFAIAQWMGIRRLQAT